VLPSYHDVRDFAIPKKWGIVTRDGCARLLVFSGNKSVPDGETDGLWVAMSAKAPSDCFQMLVNCFHRIAKVVGNLPRASTGGETSDDVHPSFGEH
jgi:hypothetical protein